MLQYVKVSHRYLVHLRSMLYVSHTAIIKRNEAQYVRRFFYVKVVFQINWKNVSRVKTEIIALNEVKFRRENTCNV